MSDHDHDYDVIVIGSGFGGSVAALRLTEKGYSVCVLEAGRRFAREDLPKNSWDLRNYLWAPSLGLYGIQRIHLLNNVMILAGAGVGGGSLNYANTLYVPPPAFFQDRQWGHITDWQDELGTHYDQARRMLGVRPNPTMTPSDVHLKAAAERMGAGDTFHLAQVGVYFGDGRDARCPPEDSDRDGGGDRDGDPRRTETQRATPRQASGAEVPDPYFGGAGPSRRACTECGECMTGCRHGAKNTLTENYLYLAEQAGARILPMTTVVDVREYGGTGRATEEAAGAEAEGGGYLVGVVPTRSRRGRGSRRRG
ncbi:FAD-binding protein, partial [Streptomyces oceani]|uniref:FAD-binding protein n=1 Tax=Streptomyces oceani TaxID=1075402 RepID=UPI001112F11C